MATFILKYNVKNNVIVNKGYTYLPSGMLNLIDISTGEVFLNMEYKGKYEKKIKIKNELIIDDLLAKNIISTELLTELFMNRYLFEANGNLKSNIKGILNSDNRSIKIYPFLVEEFMKYRDQNKIDISGTILDNVLSTNINSEFIEVNQYKQSFVGKTYKQICRTSEEKRFGALLQDNYIDFDTIEKYLPAIFDAFKFSLNENFTTYTKDCRIKAGWYTRIAKMIKFEINDNNEFVPLEFTSEDIARYKNYIN